MDMMEVWYGAAMGQPHQVTVSGSFIHFETDMAAPLIITGTGNITICGKNLFNFDPTEILLLKNGSGSDRWGCVVAKHLATMTLSAVARASDPGTGFNINSCKLVTLNSNATVTSSFIANTGTVTNRTFAWEGNESYITLLSSYASSADSAKNATANKLNAYNIQCEVGSAATAFEAYMGSTAPAGTARKSLVGINNIWSDNGSVTVTYWTH